MGNPDQPAETWHPGDMAECIRDDWNAASRALAPSIRLPQIGDRAMVLGIDTITRGRVGLQLLGFDAAFRWEAIAFRKIVLSKAGADRRIDRPIEELV